MLPLAQSRNCTLREATIIGSALSKVSVPAVHSAAALLKLSEMDYTLTLSVFIKILLNKNYALPKRVIESLFEHFCGALSDSRQRPIVWHQTLLSFCQRYKNELSVDQKEQLKQLIKTQNHYLISPEIKRELVQANNEE